MREDRTETIVGAAVLAAALGFGIFAAKSAGIGTGSDAYDLTASFRSAEGITTGTDVRLAGVKIGQISDMSLTGGSLDNFAPGDEIEDTQGAISLISLLLKFVSGEGDSG